ncbi:hypothetical protein FPV25_03215 [Carnobacterium sp. PL17GRE32]|uniref:hypothetical protein n=1 Tax=Carnobacterium sp. PL17GRE32 TaxID=2592355 RepID=UPI0011ED64C5|nr:hypothetical protein [Carnobacterium sp. PL17GRE32]KAF3306039.1 hypothetical protein FPV25_03215 [Carnobacterium sp. PL17GRE32]
MANNNMDFSRISEDEKVNGIKITNVPKYIREKAYLTDFSETLAQLAEMIIQLGVNLSLDPDGALEWARKLQESVSQSEFDSWVATLLDGGPSLFFETKAALVATHPNGAPGVALVRETDPAKIYVWNGTAWEDFGDYQGIEIKDGAVDTPKLANNSVTYEKTDFIYTPKNLLKKLTYSVNYMWSVNSSGITKTKIDGYVSLEPINVSGESNLYRSVPSSVLFMDKNGNNIQSEATSVNSPAGAITIPGVAELAYISLATSSLESGRILFGTTDISSDVEEVTLSDDVKIEGSSLISDVDGKLIKTKSLKPEKFSFLELAMSPNLFDGMYIQGKYLDGSHTILNTEGRIIVLDIKPNVIYSVINPNKALENGVNYFKLATSTMTAAQIKSHIGNLSLDGSVKSGPINENYYQLTSDSNDKSVVIQASRYTDAYVEVLEGAYTEPLYDGYNQEKYQFTNDIVLPASEITEISTKINVNATDTEITVKMADTMYTLTHGQIPFSDGGITQNYDSWRITDCKVKGQSIVNNGAWETAISLKDLPDFMGTMHGYEKYTNIIMFVDNKKITTGEFKAEKFEFLVKGYLIKQGTQDDQFLNFTRHYIFANNELLLKQRFEWLENLEVVYPYVSMLPIKPEFSTSVIRNDEYTEYDLSTVDTSLPTRQMTAGVSEIKIFSDLTGVSMSVDVDNFDKMRNFINQQHDYNKVYWSYSANEMVSVGTVWNTKTIWNIF